MNNREQGTYEAVELARKALQPGEKLLYSEKQSNAWVGIGVIMMIAGVIWVGLLLYALIWNILDGSSLDAGIIILLVIFIFIGVFFLFYAGFYRAVIIPKNINIITDRRLCVRGKSLFGKPIDRDFTLASIEKTYITKERRGKALVSFISVKMKNENAVHEFYAWKIDGMMELLDIAINEGKGNKNEIGS